MGPLPPLPARTDAAFPDAWMPTGLMETRPALGIAPPIDQGSFQLRGIASRSDALPSPRVSPSVVGASSRSAAGGPAPSRRAMRIFYPLEEECPAQYYPKLRTVDGRWMRLVRAALLVMCVMQLAASFYIYKHSHMHDHVYELFTVGANALSALAALSGFLGVALESRGALLFFYINQLWSLSNVCTFFVMSMEAYEQQLTACRMLALGDMSADEAQSRELGCDGIEARHRMLLGVMGALLAQLWISCFLARTFSEMVQDMQSDDDDRQLVRFIWERRRETWQQLRRFEDVVQRQFEELRASLVSKQGLLSQLSAS